MNGYSCNTEINNLEKSAEPNFKVWYKVKNIKTGNIYEIVKIIPNYYIAKYLGSDIMISFNNQDEYELVSDKFDIGVLKPFESRVLVRNNDTEKWKSNFWGFYNSDNTMNHPYECCGTSFAQCIPYEGNEHLLGKIDNCDEYFRAWKC